LAELTLASASPQRRAILGQLGLAFRVAVAGVDELTSGDGRTLVLENAGRKARAVDGDPILGVDTDVVIDGEVLGKPDGAAEAAEFMRRLSGRTHEVMSGIVLRRAGEERAQVAVTRVRFRALDERQIAWYLSSGEWSDRAGGYAIQGRGAALVAEIQGDYWNVVGLPVPALVDLLPELFAPEQPGSAG
jgi:septum formation protein